MLRHECFGHRRRKPAAAERHARLRLVNEQQRLLAWAPLITVRARGRAARCEGRLLGHRAVRLWGGVVCGTCRRIPVLPRLAAVRRPWHLIRLYYYSYTPFHLRWKRWEACGRAQGRGRCGRWSSWGCWCPRPRTAPCHASAAAGARCRSTD
jgi:hypothetical protein